MFGEAPECRRAGANRGRTGDAARRRERAAADGRAFRDLKRVIAERFGVDFHPRYVGKLLKKLWLLHISARPRHPAQDERIVEGFKKTSRAR